MRGKAVSVLLASAALIFSARAEADGTYISPESAWATTRIGFDVSDVYFGEVKCFDIGVEYTLSCLRGFNAAGKLARPQLALVSRAAATRRGLDIVRDFGEMTLARVVTTAPIPSFRRYLAVRSAEDGENLALARQIHARYKNADAKPADFRALIRGLRATIPASIPDQMIVGVALNGQLTATDAHAYLIPGASFNSGNDSVALKRIGIGVLIQHADRGFAVAEVIPGGAAEGADIAARDVILEIDGERVDYNLDTDQVIQRLLGEEGSPIDLKIERSGVERRIRLKRKAYEMKMVSGRILDLGAARVGVIKLISFSYHDACKEIGDRIREMRSQVSGFVLDLRNNGGGYVDQASCIAGLFLGKGVLVYNTRDLGSKRMDAAGERTKEDRLTDLPLVVLVNEGSGSASELLAGALQDHRRAWIAGERTFGKGSIQFVDSFEYDPLSIIAGYTAKIFFQPNGRTNQGQGIVPDFVVPYKPDATDEERWSPREFEMFPAAVRVEVQPWVQPRPDEVARLDRCRASSEEVASGDYQLNESAKLTLCSSRIEEFRISGI